MATYLGSIGSDPAAIASDIIKRPFISVGFTAFVLLLNSTKAMIRPWRRWQQLHRLFI